MLFDESGLESHQRTFLKAHFNLIHFFDGNKVPVLLFLWVMSAYHRVKKHGFYFFFVADCTNYEHELLVRSFHVNTNKPNFLFLPKKIHIQIR